MATAQDPSKQIYKSLLVSFSSTPTLSESQYQEHGLQKTRGTLFILPPNDDVLRQAYENPPRPRTMMSSGAVALCKHFQRIPDDPTRKRTLSTTGASRVAFGRQHHSVSDMDGVHDDGKNNINRNNDNIDNDNNDKSANNKHPFWTEPVGSNANKNQIALNILNDMLVDSDGVWRNVMFLHQGVAVYEIRNSQGWGMRWTLDIEEVICGPGRSQFASSNTFEDKDSSRIPDTKISAAVNANVKETAEGHNTIRKWSLQTPNQNGPDDAITTTSASASASSTISTNANDTTKANNHAQFHALQLQDQDQDQDQDQSQSQSQDQDQDQDQDQAQGQNQPNSQTQSQIKPKNQPTRQDDAQNHQLTDPNEKEWRIKQVAFRGFLEPIKDVNIM